MTTHLFVIVSDTHGNSTAALSPSVVTRDDGDTWRPSKSVRWLNRCWYDFWQQMTDKAKQHGATKHVVFNGDMMEGDHHNIFGLVSKNPLIQQKIVLDVLEPALDFSDYRYFVRGTPVHVGGQAWCEEWLARDCDGWADKGETNKSHYVLRVNIGGVTFAVAHHRKQRRLPWTIGGAANSLAAKTIINYFDNYDVPPDWVIRAHGHKYSESRLHRTKVVFLPAWKLTCEFVHKIEPDTLADIGGVYFVIKNGEVIEWDRVQYRHKRPRFIDPTK